MLLWDSESSLPVAFIGTVCYLIKIKENKCIAYTSNLQYCQNAGQSTHQTTRPQDSHNNDPVTHPWSDNSLVASQNSKFVTQGKNLSTLAFLWVGDLRTTAAGLSLGDVVGILELDSILHTSILSWLAKNCDSWWDSCPSQFGGISNSDIYYVIMTITLSTENLWNHVHTPSLWNIACPSTYV